MSGWQQKKQRILRTLESGVSYKALRRVARRLADDEPAGGAGVLDPQSIEKALEEEYGSLRQCIQLTTEVKGQRGTFDWEVAVGQRILPRYLQSAAFAPYVTQTLEQCGNSYDNPWHLIFYCDELVPGAARKINNSRKTQAYYLGVLELPSALRYHREAWIPIAFLRSPIGRDVVGGWSTIASLLLERLFCGPLSIRNAGITLELPACGPRVFFFAMHCTIGDSPALQQLWGTFGCNSNVPCSLNCLNLVSASSGLASHDASGVLVDASCTDRSRLVFATNQDVWEKFDVLAANQPLVNKTRFREMDMSAGIHYVPTGLMANVALREHMRPADASTCDPMHVMVSNGVVNFEVYHLFSHCGWARTYNHLRAIANAQWKTPKCVASVDFSRPFDSYHQKASADGDSTFKCQASEMLSAVPLIRYYVDTVLATNDAFSLQVTSFRAVHDLLSLTMQSKANGNAVVHPDRIDGAASHHLRSFQAAYGKDKQKPKHHQELHASDNARKHGGVCDCFTQERKGGSVK